MKSILIVDDEAHVRRVARLSLEAAGYEVYETADGEEALAVLHERSFDAVVTDIQMPRMTGLELCERIADEMPDRKFWIFVVTSRSEAEYRDWIANLPQAEFLEKPLSLRDLVDRLRHHLGEQP